VTGRRRGSGLRGADDHRSRPYVSGRARRRGPRAGFNRPLPDVGRSPALHGAL